MKMKKMISILLTAIAIVMITSCGKNGNTNARDMNTQTNVQSVLEQGMTAQSNTNESVNAVIAVDKINDEQADTNDETADEQVDTGNEAADEQDGTDGVDVDLTVLSSTMIYSEVYNMMYYPENYIGKTVKMEGQFAFYLDESTAKYYFACIILICVFTIY